MTRECERFQGREIGQLWRSIDQLMLKALPQKNKLIMTIFIVINNNDKYTLVSRIFRLYCSIFYHAVVYKFLEKRGKDRIVKEEMHRNLNK